VNEFGLFCVLSIRDEVKLGHKVQANRSRCAFLVKHPRSMLTKVFDVMDVMTLAIHDVLSLIDEWCIQLDIKVRGWRVVFTSMGSK